MAASVCDDQGARGIVLALDVDEVLFPVRELAENLVEVERVGVHVDLS